MTLSDAGISAADARRTHIDVLSKASRRLQQAEGPVDGTAVSPGTTQQLPEVAQPPADSGPDAADQPSALPPSPGQPQSASMSDLVSGPASTSQPPAAEPDSVRFALPTLSVSPVRLYR